MPLIVKSYPSEVAFTRRVGEYVRMLTHHLTCDPEPNTYGVLELLEELDADHEMYMAVWAHMKGWQRTMIKGIRCNAK